MTTACEAREASTCCEHVTVHAVRVHRKVRARLTRFMGLYGRIGVTNKAKWRVVMCGGVTGQERLVI